MTWCCENQDACPDPRDGGCKGWEAAGLPNGTFYNNNIGQCTAKQVIQSDARPTVAGTFIWSGFDYYGEARLLNNLIKGAVKRQKNKTSGRVELSWFRQPICTY